MKFAQTTVGCARPPFDKAYPDLWRDYGDLRLTPDDLFANITQLLAAD